MQILLPDVLQWANTLLIALVGYLLHRTLSKMDDRIKEIGIRSHDHGSKIQTLLVEVDWLKRMDALEERLARAVALNLTRTPKPE